MNRSSRVQRLAALLAVAGLGLAPVPGRAAQQTFSESTQVVVVEVPVQVIKDGEPVRGMTAKDFELYDGRRKVPVTGFDVLDLTAPAAAGAPAVPVPASARRHFLLMFDLSYSEPKSVVKAREAAQKVVDTLHPTDLVSVATYSTQQGPQLVLGFTPDRRQIAAAIDTLGTVKLADRSPDPLKLVYSEALASRFKQPAAASSGASERAAAKEDALIDTLANFAASAAHAERKAQEQQVLGLTRSFSDLARLMAEVEGRKYVVYLSEGFDASLVSGKSNTGPVSAGDDEGVSFDAGDAGRIIAPTDATGSDDRFGSSHSLNAVEKMLESFRRADCVIQAVDIGGLRAGGQQGASRADGRETLFNMAKSTGGELFENYNDLSAAMGQMLRRTGVTYVLSFQPADLKPDGSFHNLKVELKNAPRGTRVVARPGYYAPVPFKSQPVQVRLLEAASDLMSKDSGTIATSVLAAPFGGKERAYVPVVIEVDGATLLAGKQDPKLAVEIYIYALDASGTIQDFLNQTIGLDLTKVESSLRQTGLKFFGHVELAPGTYSVRTLVRNGSTGATSLRVTPVTVPPTGQATLLPALFQETPGRWVAVPETPKAGQQLPYPFMLKERPYIPASRPVLTPGKDAQLVLVGYNLQPGEWKAQAQVMAADGQEMPGGAFKVVDKEIGSGAGPSRLLATFQPPAALPPGTYSLRVTLTDGAGKAESSTSQFTVGAAGAPGGR
ncbi:MAG TPA: VWA domain-containing protein [Thermoanaerobaculia bacterium]|jgi:VWFA-related protein|nr:VWA domain-containing protein [Thermoanaerobaculia bacterium]